MEVKERASVKRNKKIAEHLANMYELAITQEKYETPCEQELVGTVGAKEHSFREILLCIIVQMMIDPKLKATEQYKDFNARGIYDKGPVKQFLLDKGIPFTKSGPLNVSKAETGISRAWAEERRSSESALQLVSIVEYLEKHNTFEEIQAIGVSLIKKLLKEAVRVQSLSVKIPPSTDPDKIMNACIHMIDYAPDAGNTPQQIVAQLMKCYHCSIQSDICIVGGEDRASVTSTTSKKPGDITEERYNQILKVYEITIKTFDLGRIVDSYDCIQKFQSVSKQQIREVIVICRTQDCPAEMKESGMKLYMGSIDYQNVKYYFWNIYEWISCMLQKMSDDGKELFTVMFNCYVNDQNTSEDVKLEWRKIHGIE